MEIGTSLTELLKIVLPAALVLLTAWIFLKQKAGNKAALREKLLPLQLQAYERLVLLVERINPSSLLVRRHQAGMDAAEFNALLIGDIRAEFEHNVSQQLYVSEASWEAVCNLKERTAALINGIAQQLPGGADARTLTRAVLDRLNQMEEDPYQQCLALLRRDMHRLF